MNASGVMQDGARAGKIEALQGDHRKSSVFTARERLGLELAERMTRTNRRVTDAFFKRLQKHFSDEELVELAAAIALENFFSKFNPVFAIESQNLCPLAIVKTAANAAQDRISR